SGASVNPSSTNPLPPELDVAVSAQFAVKSIVSPVQKIIIKRMFTLLLNLPGDIYTPSNVHFKMKYLAAYLLLALAGNEAPSSADIKAVLSSVGIDAEGDRLEKVISELQGKDLQELIAEGSTKLASVPSGGAGAAPAAAAASGGAAAAPAEEKAEEKEEESDEDMGFGLFD
ncbi:Ribosomal protein 60S, partial [Penicillium soppii]|uniref:Ribosomal protein 60S n=1 Tax=Penicillium soppii TaxID=69789 RepID=UPI002549523E